MGAARKGRSVRWALGMAAAAASVLSAAVPAVPPRTPPSAAECTHAFDRGDYAQAIALSRQRLAALPADAAAQIVMARAEAARGRFEAAYQGFRNVLARHPRNTDALYYVTILVSGLA